MTLPQDYPRRLLVTVMGLSPQIVTETVYALAVDQTPPFIPTEIRLITTEKGAERAKDSLLRPESGWFHRLRADYGLPAIAFGPEHIDVLRDADGRPLDDIRTPDDNTRAADTITEVIRDLTRDRDSALHASIAGGRKTMGFYLGYALSLYGRIQDRLSHVLVSAPYESHPQFFYPTVKSRTPPHNRPYDTRDAEVTLADIPFVRLRYGQPKALIDGEVGFVEVVNAAQRAIGPTELVIDLTGRRVRAGGQVIHLRPLYLAFLAWLARRQLHGEEWLVCPRKDEPNARYADAFLDEYREILGEMGDDERTTYGQYGKGGLKGKGGMTREFFSQTKSKLHTSLRKGLGEPHADPYLVSAEGSQSRRRYGLKIDPEAIRFGPVEPTTDSARQAATLPSVSAGKATQ